MDEAIPEILCAGGVGVLRNLRNVHDSSDNIGSYRTCHQAGQLKRVMAEDVVDMQAAVVPNAPASNIALSGFAALAGRDVGLMIHIRHDDLPLAERTEPHPG